MTSAAGKERRCPVKVNYCIECDIKLRELKGSDGWKQISDFVIASYTKLPTRL
jgi:hypothetical protein